MRTTVELSDSTYRRLRGLAAERGLRGFSPIVEEAVESFLDRGDGGDLPATLAEAEGAWSEADVEEWERSREEAWSTWRAGLSSTRTS
ncbi:MAG: ribbon-helix-helix protein, CopG family [Solirubrobacterales bacterium]